MVNIKQYSVLSGVVRESLVLKGTISKKIEAVERHTKEVIITENGTVDILPDDGNVLGKVTVTAAIEGGSAAEYEGDYEIAPKFEEQTLSTAYKVLKKDVKVKAIPVERINNETGGITVVIG